MKKYKIDFNQIYIYHRASRQLILLKDWQHHAANPEYFNNVLKIADTREFNDCPVRAVQNYIFAAEQNGWAFDVILNWWRAPDGRVHFKTPGGENKILTPHQPADFVNTQYIDEWEKYDNGAWIYNATPGELNWQPEPGEEAEYRNPMI